MTDTRDDVSTTTDDASAATRIDTILYLLANRRRRDALRCLRQEGPLTEAELCERVTARERSRSTRPDDDPHERVTIDMRHAQLPKLENAGILSRDDEGRVTYQGRTLLDRWLDRVTEAVSEDRYMDER